MIGRMKTATPNNLSAQFCRSNRINLVSMQFSKAV